MVVKNKVETSARGDLFKSNREGSVGVLGRRGRRAKGEKYKGRNETYGPSSHGDIIGFWFAIMSVIANDGVSRKSDYWEPRTESERCAA